MSQHRPQPHPSRRRFLAACAVSAAGVAAGCWGGEQTGGKVHNQDDSKPEESQARPMPVLFIGHGAPTNAIEDNTWSRAFAGIPAGLPRPTAIVSISAHWYIRQTLLTSNEAPKTIHDFRGFPQKLHEMIYPAPGHVGLAGKIRTLIGEQKAALSQAWGLDHGTWTVLHRMYPQADIPVVQLSINRTLSAAEHIELGKALAPLRHEGVLIMGSGNMTHNLRHAMAAFRGNSVETPQWASRFDREVVDAIAQRDSKHLGHILEQDHGRMSHPSPDHYLPLLYAYGASQADESIASPVEGWIGSLSMRSIQWG